MRPAPSELFPHEPRTTPLTQRYTEGYPGELRGITVPAENIGLDKWQEMLELTDNDNVEIGLVISTNRQGVTHQSKVFKGEAKGIFPADQPYGRADIPFSGWKRAVLVHTHPMEGDLRQKLTTTVPSDDDIRGFFYLDCNAYVIIDPNGIHLLTRIKPVRRPTPPPKDLVDQLYEKRKKDDGLSRHLQMDIARELPKYGISYFYHEDIPPTGAETVTFKKLPA